MARHQFGGGLSDWTFGTSGSGLQVVGGITIRCYSAETGGVQYTDLRTLSNVAVSSIVSSNGSDGRALGTIAPFYGPDGVAELWVSGDNGPRARMLSTTPTAASTGGAFYNLGNLTGSVTINPANGRTQFSTLVGNVTTVVVQNGTTDGQELTIYFRQDGTGGRTFNWPNTVKLQNAWMTPSTGPNTISVVTLMWDGANWAERSRATNISAATLSGGGGGGGGGGPTGSGLQLRVVNNTGSPNADIKMYVVGTLLASGQQGYTLQSGVFKPANLADLVSGFVDIGIPLAPSGDTFWLLPKLSGRVYFSIGDDLLFSIVPTVNGPGMVHPAGWVATDPNYSFLYDQFEFTYSDSGFFCNSTNVDMFSIPITVDLYGAAHQQTGALIAGGRDNIFDDLAAIPAFEDLVIGTTRVIAPSHGIDQGLFSSTYFNTYADLVWSTLTSNNTFVTTNAGTFTGRVTGSTLNFTGGVRSFAKPTTRDILFCNGALDAPNDGLSGPVAAILGAGFNRATLHNDFTQPSDNPAQFYVNSIANHYARVLHENHTDGKAYGFAFDDVANFASYVQDGSPTAVTLTLGPM